MPFAVAVLVRSTHLATEYRICVGPMALLRPGNIVSCSCSRRARIGLGNNESCRFIGDELEESITELCPRLDLNDARWTSHRRRFFQRLVLGFAKTGG